MITEAIEKIESLSVFSCGSAELDVDGRIYLYAEKPNGVKGYEPIKVPEPSWIPGHTLAGLRDFVRGKLIPGEYLTEGGYTDIFAHIIGVSEVRLVSALKEPWLNRHTLMTITPLSAPGFRYGQWSDIESFVVGLQANFHPSEDRDLLLRLASKITSGKSAEISDDGVSQHVTTKRGVHLRDTVETPNPVRLVPRRGFPEVSELCEPSEFVFRVRGGGDDLPHLALFEADGGAWQIEARGQIKAWIEREIPGLPVIS